MSENKYPKRKHPRLKSYDYTSNGYYFVTVSLKKRMPLLSEVCVGRDAHIPPKIRLTANGQVLKKHIDRINEKYEAARVDNYIIMPDHFHIIIVIDDNNGGMRASRPTSLITIVRTLKTMVTKEIGVSLWQPSFYEEVIKSQTQFENCWNYIEYNALKEYAKGEAR